MEESTSTPTLPPLTYDEVSESLFIVSCLRPAEKLWIGPEARTLGIDAGSYVPLVQSGYRMATGNSRTATMDFLTVLVSRSKSLLDESFDTYKGFFGRSPSTLPGHEHFEAILSTTERMDNLKSLMKSAAKGLVVLGKTYGDKTLVGRLEMASENLKAAVHDTTVKSVNLLAGITNVDTTLPSPAPVDVVKAEEAPATASPAAASPKKKGREGFGGARPMWYPGSPILHDAPLQLSMGTPPTFKET